ncbi:hypothetical protein Misp03_29230 [Microbispora sp. NBRC 16548]|nr:hypothetical protein Misp03_29230 [Microbispora sp. NBRC 16548]
MQVVEVGLGEGAQDQPGGRDRVRRGEHAAKRKDRDRARANGSCLPAPPVRGTVTDLERDMDTVRRPYP